LTNQYNTVRNKQYCIVVALAWFGGDLEEKEPLPMKIITVKRLPKKGRK